MISTRRSLDRHILLPAKRRRRPAPDLAGGAARPNHARRTLFMTDLTNGSEAAIDLVLFDLGGVLIEWDPRRLYRKMFEDEALMERFLAEICTPAWNLELDRGVSFTAAVTELVARHPEQRAWIEAYQGRWIEMIGGPIDHTVRLLEGLKAQGTPLRALTNWSAETFPLVRDDPAYAFLGHFETIYVSGSLRMIKPNDDIFLHVLADLGLAPGQILFIDDSAKNIATAGRLGFATHHFSDPAALEADLRRRRLLD
jgi:2-haloacid dehalogenase